MTSMRRASNTTATALPAPAATRKGVNIPDNSSQKMKSAKTALSERIIAELYDIYRD